MAQWGTVTPDALNLRAAPNTNAAIIRELKKGEILAITDPNPGFDWLGVTVEANGEKGFVSKLYVAISDSHPNPGSVATSATVTQPGQSTDPNATQTEVKPVVVIVPFGSDTRQASGMTGGTRATVVTGLLNVRSGPSTTFDIVTKLPQNTVVEVVSATGDWAQIRYQGVAGYAAKQFLSIGAPIRTGYLREQADLFDAELVPNTLIPPQIAKTAASLVARVWNTYGGLIEPLAKMLNIPRGTMVGVIGAESGGNAFSADGRMIIRFENHIFFNEWGKNNQDVFFRFFQFDQSAGAGHTNHKFRPNMTEDFQGFHGNQEREWQVLTFARNLSDTAALRSISMGAPQIMGFNFKRVGFESVQQMFEEFARSAHAQIIGLFDFVREPLGISTAIQALQNGDFFTFAGIYNGRSRQQQHYADLIASYANAFNVAIKMAKPAPAPDQQRGPRDEETKPTPPAEPVNTAPVNPVTPTPVAADPAPVMPASPDPNVVIVPFGTIVVDTVAAASPGTPPVVVVASDPAGVNIRSMAGSLEPSTILVRLAQNDIATALEPLESVKGKLAQPPEAKQYIRVRTDKGVVGFAAAWLLTLAGAGSAIPTDTVDSYINGIPDRFEIPAGFETLRTHADRIGLPDPFDTLPIQVRTADRLVNLQINGFGPNTFAAIHWQSFYKNTSGMHNGLDFIVETGTPLLAVTDGIIIRNWPFIGTPNDKSLALWAFMPPRFRDAQGRRLLSNVLIGYAHMRDNNVRADKAIVNAGDVIGISGTPGNQLDNDHLHMEVHLLNGDPGFPATSNRRLLTYYKAAQPNDNNTPFNPILFFSRRYVRYLLDRSTKGRFNGRPMYPTAQELLLMGLSNFPTLDAFTVAYYRYSRVSVWTPASTAFGTGVALTSGLADRLPNFPDFASYPADFV